MGRATGARRPGTSGWSRKKVEPHPAKDRIGHRTRLTVWKRSKLVLATEDTSILYYIQRFVFNPTPRLIQSSLSG